MKLRDRMRLSGPVFQRPDSEKAKPKRCVFISTEGRKTERDYFEHLNAYLQQNDPACPVQIHVLRHDGYDFSDPMSVLQLLEDCQNLRGEMLFSSERWQTLLADFPHERIRLHLDAPDRFSVDEQRLLGSRLLQLGINLDYCQWLRQMGGKEGDGEEGSEDVYAIVLDRDAQTHTREVLIEIREICQRKGFVMALTNPCFDFWLLLHLLDVRKEATDEELAEFLANRKVSDNHTAVSKKVSDLAHHGKHITEKAFRAYYTGSHFADAVARAKGFSTDFDSVLHNLGTMIPALMDKILADGLQFKNSLNTDEKERIE